MREERGERREERGERGERGEKERDERGDIDECPGRTVLIPLSLKERGEEAPRAAAH